MMKIAVLGVGAIANKMALTVKNMQDVELYAAASRSIDRARAFAEKYSIPKAYGSYDEMLADENVDLVYIATPHSHHYSCVKLCLEAGKNVLCEKAFTVNAEEAKELFQIAEERQVLLTEAIWTRYMPSRGIIDGIIDRGEIGEVTSLTANLGYEITHKERIMKPELAGGALLDLGVYVINFARMVMGENMTGLSGTAVMENGVDIIDSITMVFDDKKMASTQANAHAAQNRAGVICGTQGYIEVTNINNPERICVFNKEYEMIKEYFVPEQITGYEYEVLSCMRAIENHELECPEMPHAETIRIMEIMDELRASWGYEIPLNH